MQLHLCTGADCVSGLYGLRNRSISAALEKAGKAQQMIQSLGSTLEVINELVVSLEMFTRNFIYANVKLLTMGQSRATKWNGMKKKITSRIYPDAESFL